MATRKSAARPATNRRAKGAKAILSKLPDLSLSKRRMASLRRFTRLPVTRYIAGGVALFGIVRLAQGVMGSYPQIGEFFEENLSTVEGKFREWTGREESSDIADARH